MAHSIKNKKGIVVISITVAAIFLLITLEALTLLAYHRQQIATKYINSVKAYYLSVSGVNYIHQRCYSSFHGPAPSAEHLSARFSITNSGDTIEVTSDVTDVLNAVIKSTGKINGGEITVSCASGEESFPLGAYYGLYKIVDLSMNWGWGGMYEYNMPITKWKIEKR